MRTSLVLITMAALGAGCSNSSHSTDDMSTTAPDLAVAKDGGVNDDMATGPQVLGGSRVAVGDGLTIFGTTTDQVIYTDGNGAVMAVGYDGTGQTTISPASDSPYPDKIGDVVLIYTDTPAGNSTYTLSTWVKGGTLMPIATKGTGIATIIKGSPSRIIYTDNSTDGILADVYIADIDGQHPMKLETQIVTTGGCDMSLYGAGSTFIVNYCPSGAQDQGSDVPSTTNAYNATTGAKVPLYTGKNNTVFLSDDGSRLAILNYDNSLSTILTSGVGGSSDIGTDVNPDPYVAPTLKSDGSVIFFSTNAGDIKRWSSSGLVTLASGFTAGLYGASPDLKYGVAFKSYDGDNLAGEVDSFSLETAGAPVMLSMFGAPSGSTPFSSDSSKVFLVDNVLSDGSGFGTAGAIAVTGGTITPYESGVYDLFSVANHKVVELINVSSDDSTTDFHLVAETGGTATTIATTADFQDQNGRLFGISPAGDKVVYTTQVKTATAGIYVYNVQ